MPPRQKKDGSLQSTAESDAPFSVFRAADDLEKQKDMYDQMERDLSEEGMTDEEKRANRMFDNL